MANTTKLGLPLIDGSMTADVPRDFNALAQAVDAKAGTANGIATLGADGKVPAGQLNVTAPADASTTTKGIVQLNNTVTSTSITQAATANAVKTVNDSLTTHSADYVKHPGFATVTGTTALVATLSPAPTAYVDGMGIALKIANASTGATTLNVNSLGAKTIKKANGNDITSGFLKAGSIYSVRYNATTGFFILQGEGGEYGTAGPEQVLTGYTVGTESGVVPGTLQPGKRYATGTAIIDASGVVSVNTLAFTPSLINISAYVGASYRKISTDSRTIDYASVKWTTSPTTLNTGVWTVTANGFSTLLWDNTLSGNTVTWYAYE